jgi:hypothetical protein
MASSKHLAVVAVSRRAPTAALAVLAMTAIVLVTATGANAGEWAQLGCSGAAGPLPAEGWSSTYIGGPSSDSGTVNDCPQPGGALENLDTATPFEAQLSGVGSVWSYLPPPGSTIAGGTLSYTMQAPHGTVYVSRNLLPANAYLTCRESTCGYTGAHDTLSIPAGGESVAVLAFCTASTGDSCPSTDGLIAEVSIYGSDIDLTNDSTPIASGLSGTLLSETVSGTAHLSFQALDLGGPGVYQVTAKLDDKTFYSATPQSNGGKCIALGHDQAGAREFEYSQPCPEEAAVSIELATATLLNGAHQLTVEVEDAAGNTTAVVNRTIMIENPEPSTSVTEPAASVAPAPLERGPCNGTPCDEAAKLIATAGEPTTITRALGRSSVMLTGRLTSPAGAPIKNAQIKFLQQIAGSAPVTQIASTMTSANGSWSLKASAGASRLLQVAFYSHTLDTVPASILDFHENVQGALSMHAPRRAWPSRPVTFTGELAGGYVPAGGESVQIEIFYGRRWRTIEVLPTNSQGRWSYKYVFSLGVRATYLFRAATVPNAGYPFLSTHSRPVRVTVQG